ncbi:MAG: hypothetical protein K2M75_03440 [Clostridia bacterium]|nr:hypothetical protein [Clostridia bacterium]
MGIPSLNAPIEMSKKIQVENVNGIPVISGKIKNKTRDAITLENQCFVISLYNPRSGWTYLHITSQDTITIDAGREFDLSSAELEYEEYDYLKSTYTWGYSYVVDSVTVYPYNYGNDPILIYDRAVKEEGEIYATFSGILALIFASVTLFFVLPYVVSKRRYIAAKKRFELARQSLVEIGGGVYLRGAFCQKKSIDVKPTLFSKIKGDFKALTMGVIIKTKYLSAEAMDFVITERGFYIAPAKSKIIDVKNMEFFDKEELDKTQIYTFKNNVVLNPLFNDSYFVFDLSQNTLSPNSLTELLGKMFEENDEIQHVDFDESSAQKNI